MRDHTIKGGGKPVHPNGGETPSTTSRDSSAGVVDAFAANEGNGFDVGVVRVVERFQAPAAFAPSHAKGSDRASAGDDAFSDDPNLHLIINLYLNGIQSKGDIKTFFTAMEELAAAPLPELSDNPRRAFQFCLGITRLFRKYKIPYRTVHENQGSKCARSAEEDWDRMHVPAVTHGVDVVRGRSPAVLLHEMTHALPQGDVIELIRKIFPEVKIETLEFPENIADGDDLTDIFVKVAGIAFRQEALSGFSEILFFNFINNSVKVLDEQYLRPTHVEEGSRYLWPALQVSIRMKQYINSGTYIGDNHILLYQLRALHEVAQEIHDDPQAWKKQKRALPPLPRDLGRAAMSGNIMALKRKLMPILKEFRGPAEQILADDESAHPLKPLFTRIAPLYRMIEASMPQEAERKFKDLKVGVRATPRLEGDVEWLRANQDSASEMIEMLVDFYAEGITNLSRYIELGEYRPAGASALLIPDQDLERFWNDVFKTAHLDNGLSAPLLLPLTLHGHLDEVKRLIPSAQTDKLSQSIWTRNLFDSIYELSRAGDADALDMWIDVLGSEVDDFWAIRHGYRKMWEQYADEGIPYGIDGIYSALLNVAINVYDDDVDEDELLDLDFMDDSGQHSSSNAKSDFHMDQLYYARRFPAVDRVKQLAVVVGHLRSRGMGDQANAIENHAKKILEQIISVRTNEVKYKIYEKYLANDKPMRPADPFLTHVEKLQEREARFLPHPKTLAAELFTIIDLPASMGGGWARAIGYLEILPDSFTKTFACRRLADEIGNLKTKPTNAELINFINRWSQSLEACKGSLPENSNVQPNEYGIGVGKSVELSLVNAGAAISFKQVKTDDNLGPFVQGQIYAMISVIPAASDELSNIRSGLVESLS